MIFLNALTIPAAAIIVASPLHGAEPDVSSSSVTQTGRTLPFLAEEAIKRGYELPLPFGVSGIYNYIQRDIRVDSVGTSVVVSKHWELFAEYGFNLQDVQMLATGLTFRF